MTATSTGARHRRPAVVLALVLLAALLSPFVAVAGAQEVPETLTMRAVDTRDGETVTFDFLWTGDPAEVDALELREDGELVEAEVAPLPPDSPRKGVMFVIDTSTPMEESGALTEARAAIRRVVEGAAPGTEFGLVLAGDKAAVLENLTPSKAQIYAKLDSISTSNVEGGALWGAVKIAGASLASRSSLQPNIVVIAGSNDSVTPEMAAPARGEAVSSGAAVIVTALTGKGLGTGAWNGLVDRTGGLMLATDDPLALDDHIVTAGSILGTQQYRGTYTSAAVAEAVEAQQAEEAAAAEEGREAVDADLPAIDLRLEVGDRTTNAVVLPGNLAVGQNALQPTAIPESTGIEPLQGQFGLVVTMVVVLIAAVLLVYGLVSIFVRDDSLSSMLRPYSEGYGAGLDDEEGGGEDRSAFVQRAVEITEQVAESQGYLSRVEGALERASIPLRAGEALALYGAIVLLATLLGLVLFGVVAAIFLGVIAALFPTAFVNFKANRRRKQFLAQLPDMLQLLSGTLRAGYSLMQGVEAVAHESADPMGYELRRVVTESRLGRPLEEALESTAVRMDSPDFAWAVMAIRIQREVGGNLSELLLTVAETMIARERLRRDVAALTAEGRVSAVVLGALPVLVGVAIYVMNPGYMDSLFNTGVGLGLLAGAFIAMGIGFLWMKKIIDIEI